MKKWSRHLLAAGALALGMSAAHADDNNTLYFYNWTEYVPPGLLEQFTKETGIKVIYSTYESNETMYAKLKTYKDGAYDLVVPSTYYVDKMRKEGMIQKIDKSKLSRLTRITTIPFRISGVQRRLALTVMRWIRNLSPAGPICGNLSTRAACC